MTHLHHDYPGLHRAAEAQRERLRRNPRYLMRLAYTLYPDRPDVPAAGTRKLRHSWVRAQLILADLRAEGRVKSAPISSTAEWDHPRHYAFARRLPASMISPRPLPWYHRAEIADKLIVGVAVGGAIALLVAERMGWLL